MNKKAIKPQFSKKNKRYSEAKIQNAACFFENKSFFFEKSIFHRQHIRSKVRFVGKDSYIYM